MDLLPKEHAEFSKETYWNDFFSKRKSQPFEWYGEYDSLCNILDKYIHTKDRVLIVGCGNSKLSASLYDVGIQNTISIDISEPVIKQMQVRYGKDRPQLIFERMDVFQMSYENETFSVVLDKGTLDALLVDSSQQCSDKISSMFSEISRVLKSGGRYVCVSLLQEHVLNKVLDWFVENGWLMRFHRCTKAEAKQKNAIAFPVFVIVLTKMKKIQSLPMVLEIIQDENSTPKRCALKKDIVDYVKSAQHFAFLKHYLNKKNLNADDVCLELCSPETEEIKYRLYVVDREKMASTQFAIFVVPQGRETEWLFCTPEGRQELAKSANCQRLIVVHLLRNVVYKNVEEVKQDLSSKVMDLAPSSWKGQVPFLSLGDDVGQRDIRYTGHSDASGDYVVEDVTVNNTSYRRLIFLKNPYLVQSEAKLITVQKKKKKLTEIDFDFLACEHHPAMIAGLTFLNSMYDPNILQIGLGGGSLVMYLHKHFPDAKIDVIELDAAIVEIAKQWFGLMEDKRISIKTDDGINFIQEAVNNGLHYDAIMLDVDSKDPTLGISSPPVSFLELTVLKNLAQLISERGIVITNLACRNTDLHTEAYSKLKSVFKSIFSQKIPGEVNEVISCSNRDNSCKILDEAKSKTDDLMKHLKKQSKNCPEFDMSDLLSSLTQIT